MLQRRGRLTYGALKRQFQLDDAALEDLKDELLYGQRLAVEEDERVLVWTGDTTAPTSLTSGPAFSSATPARPVPLSPTPRRIWPRRSSPRAAPWKASASRSRCSLPTSRTPRSLSAGLDPEEARQLLDPALHRMMDAVHRFEGTVNQVLGDGIMALFGAPIAHEDHAVRACYAALAMQAAMRRYTEEVRRAHGMELQIRVGLNAGEVVVRAIGNDLHMDYSAVGQTTHLAARMEQLATPGQHPPDRRDPAAGRGPGPGQRPGAGAGQGAGGARRGV